MSTIAIVGAGHVGVVYAAGLAELGHRIRVVDVNAKRIAGLRRGKIWYYEPGLPELLERNIRRRRLTFTSSYAQAIDRANFVFVCVPTPASDQGGLDDSFLRAAFEQIQENVRRPGPIIVNKSTVPVGTGDSVERIFTASAMRVVSNPEFLAEGRGVEDFFHPTRIVIGSHDRVAAQAVADLYSPLRAPVVFTDPVTAELSKLAANAFLATKISFANVLSAIGQAVGADGDDLNRAISLDPRIGHGHLRAGLGFGGSCLPKDLAAMETLARQFTGNSDLFQAVAAINRAQRARVIGHLAERMGILASKRIAILGASFKANTDDIRDSPALALARELSELQAEVVIYDPAVNGELRVLARGWLGVSRSAQAAIRNADAVVVATEWPEFRALDFGKVKRLMRGSIIVDGRGILDPHALASLGIDFFSFARGHDHSARVAQPAAVATA